MAFAPLPAVTVALAVALAVTVAAFGAYIWSGSGGGDTEAGTAHVQSAPSQIKIGVLTSDPAGGDAGPLAAMQIARHDLNDEYEALNFRVVFERIDVSDYEDRAEVERLIGAALEKGFAHFIGPSSDPALFATKSVIEELSPDSIIISPASSWVANFKLDADDNLFRLVPNTNTLAYQLAQLYDKNGLEKVIMIGDEYIASEVRVLPAVTSGYFDSPVMPIATYDASDPDSLEKNLAAARQVKERLEADAARHGWDKVGILYSGLGSTYSAFVHAIGDSPEFDVLRDVPWHGRPSLVDEHVLLADPVTSAFSADVGLVIPVYEVEPNEISLILSYLPNPTGAHNKIGNYAAYDAVHLLADAIAIGGADNPDLKEVVYGVAGGTHAVDHTVRLLGEGAMGDYELDPETGDLVAEEYLVHEIVRTDSDGYDWRKTAVPGVH